MCRSLLRGLRFSETIVQSLAVFNVSKAVDREGREGRKIEVDVRPKPGDPDLSERVQMPSQQKACRLNPPRVTTTMVRRKKMIPVLWKVWITLIGHRDDVRVEGPCALVPPKAMFYE